MERWILRRKGADFDAISEKFGINPITARLIRNKDIIGEEAIDFYLNGSLSDLHDGMMMKGMGAAIGILMEKINEGQRIRIIGDYDIDGVNATYILLEGLSFLGAVVDYDIPHRIEDGYGLNRDLITRAYQDGIDTIVTCDNGIAATEEIYYAKELGMTVVVTDHHEIPYVMDGEDKDYIIPPADAVIDPKQPGCFYPFKGLCGAAVAYKLVEALCEVMGQDAYELDYLIENVAIATVGDVMELIDENRIFVKEGLQMLSRTHNKGLQSLIDICGLDRNKITAYSIGFVLGPCINASGRLDSAKMSLELLLAKTKGEADRLAGELKALNDSRKNLTTEAVEQGKEMIEASSLKQDRVLVLYLQGCHESLAGIVAGKIREAYYKPTLVITDGEEGLKGSARSIDDYHMYEELNKCQHLLTKFGGHEKAAGFSLTKDNLIPLRKLLNQNCSLTEENLQEKVVLDMQLPFEYITLDLIEDLEKLEPYGNGNKKPVFVLKNISIRRASILGKNRNVMKLQLKDPYGVELEALMFKSQFEPLFTCITEKYGEATVRNLEAGREMNILMDMTFYPEINDFRGVKNVQLKVTHFR
ncbi:MAG: single-stranded-DNA-specific exonuclease RecJ [Dorea sp.]|nr:single-stranded-DNA-specific exonuclease RecJ [Dorea sp.]